MRIIVSGTANTGKTTLINDFIAKFPTYKKAEFNYQELLGDPSTHSKNTNIETQIKILNGMIEEIATWPMDANIIMDRGPLDNIVYSLWCNSKGKEGFDDDFIAECFHANAMISNMIDMIIFIPLMEKDNPEIVEDGKREVDPEYIKEIDSIFKAIFRGLTLKQQSPMFFKGRVPGNVEVFGSREDRMSMLELLLDDEGDIGERERGERLSLNDGTLFAQGEQKDRMATAKITQEKQKTQSFNYFAEKYKKNR